MFRFAWLPVALLAAGCSVEPARRALDQRGHENDPVQITGPHQGGIGEIQVNPQ